MGYISLGVKNSHAYASLKLFTLTFLSFPTSFTGMFFPLDFIINVRVKINLIMSFCNEKRKKNAQSFVQNFSLRRISLLNRNEQTNPRSNVRCVFSICSFVFCFAFKRFSSFNSNCLFLKIVFFFFFFWNIYECSFVESSIKSIFDVSCLFCFLISKCLDLNLNLNRICLH